MASFDFVDAAAKSYEFLWRERRYVSRVVIPVIFVKVACLLAVQMMGAEKQFLLSGLVLIPGFVLEAIFAIGLIRFLLYREPMIIAGSAVPEPEDHPPLARYMGKMSLSQAWQAGLAMYLLIRIIQVAFSAWVQDYNLLLEDRNFEPEPMAPTFIGAIAMLGLLWGIVWTFRLGWLYIPLAMGIPFTKFLHRIRGLNSSFYMFATWFLCSLPLLVLYGALANIVTMAFEQGSGGFIVLDSIVLAFIEVTMVALQVVAMTHGITEIMSVGKEETKK